MSSTSSTLPCARGVRAGLPAAPTVAAAPGTISRSVHGRREGDALWLVGIAVASGIGLITVAVADTVARRGSTWGEPLFWCGMFALWVPSSVRMVGLRASRNERIALLVLLGIAMYAVSLLSSPRYLDGYDELLHWRTAQDMVRTGRVFNANPLLPVSPLYPGLEIATNAITSLTSLSLVVAGRIVVGVARLIVILALYLLYEQVSRSPRLASVAVAVYCTNPQFLFFDSSFSYESLALGLAVFALFAVARGRAALTMGGPGTVKIPTYGAALIVVMMPVAATAITHHITSFVLVLALVLVAILSSVFDPLRTRVWLWCVAAASVGCVLVWLFAVAGPVVNYLEPPIAGGVSEVIRLIRNEGGARQLFHSYVGTTPPVIEQAASVGFAVITLTAFPLGVVRTWRARRLDTFTVLFALGSLLYPVSGLFHFTSAAELGDRAYAFLFVPVAFCIAAAAVGWGSPKVGKVRTGALVIAGAVLLYGGAAIGTPPWIRLPGPYLASADGRSIELEGISAASWAGKYLPRNSRIAADRVNSVLMMTYGNQFPVRTAGKGRSLAPVFLTPQVTPSDRQLIQGADVQYIVLDYRLTRFLPWVGYYFYYLGESGAPTYRRPVPAADFNKFANLPGTSRIFDSGNIVIVDLAGLAGGG